MHFLEIGSDLERGVDATARAWASAGHATTYHFLDANLEEGDDLDDAWIAETAALARSLGAAWLCGDAGLWHVGPRDRGHGVLLPPILTASSARAMAANVRRLRETSGFEVLPENPPSHVYVGDLHLLDYFALVADGADAGLLLDVAHLAIHQRATGRAPLDGLDGFPLDRIVELHVAGASEFAHAGRRFVDDDHSPEPLADTWEILDWVLPRAPNLRALVYECERNPSAAVVPTFERLARRLETRAVAASTKRRPQADVAPAIELGAVRGLQRTLVRMQHDAAFAAQLRAGESAAVASTSLDRAALRWLQDLDPTAVGADREQRRRDQMLRNVSSEFALCAAVGPDGTAPDAWLAAFARSRWFHDAIARDDRLPLAFAAYVEEAAREAKSAVFRAFAALEIAMARARRAVPRDVAPGAGEVVASDRASLVSLAAGTHAAAVAWHAHGPAAARALVRAIDPRRIERVLLLASEEPARFGRWPELRVEPLATAVAAFLDAARTPLDAQAIARFAAAHDIDAGDIAAVVDDFVADGALVRGAEL